MSAVTPERLAVLREQRDKGMLSETVFDLLAFLEESLAQAAVLQGENDRIRNGPIGEIAKQRRRNHERWGSISIENRAPDYAGWLPTLVEEVGEVARAMQDWDDYRIRAELIDVAAVALMWIDSVDRVIKGDEE